VWILLSVACGPKHPPGSPAQGSPAQLAHSQGLMNAELGYDAAFDAWVATEPHPVPPTQVNGTPRPWASPDDFAALGWSPDIAVSGSYWVSVSDRGFQVNTVDWVQGVRVHCIQSHSMDTGPEDVPTCVIH
jgi:hypothetical protein